MLRYCARVPFVVYADFEAMVRSTGDEHPVRGHKSFEYERQTPFSVGYTIVSTFPQFERSFKYCVGEGCVHWFMEHMLEFANDAMKFYYDEKRLQNDYLVDRWFETEYQCHICHKPFQSAKEKVRDHDHVTGMYRGAAHRWCNIRLRRTCKIPVFFHNFRGYDSHFVSMALKDFPGHDIKVIGQGMEKYLTLSFGKYLVFKDSLQFLGSSLQTLATNLAKGGVDQFANLKKRFPNENDDGMRLIVRKGVYPYEYMDSFERLKEPRLPPKDAFFSKLINAGISDEDYAHAQLVWRHFNMKTMRDYHNLYLASMSVIHFFMTSECIPHLNMNMISPI